MCGCGLFRGALHRKFRGADIRKRPNPAEGGLSKAGGTAEMLKNSTGADFINAAGADRPAGFV